jgi:cell division protease FtsH
MEPRRYSDVTAAAIDVAVRALIEDAFTRARAILQANLALLRQGAAALLAHETLSGSDLQTLAAAVRLPPPEAPAAPAAAPQAKLPQPA